MTKELSKQLCELCGIKPKIKCHPWECLHVGYYKRDKCIINFKPDEECVKRRDLSGYISYPDFEQPKNFVKLYGLPVKINSSEPEETIAHILTAHFHIFDDESFLCALCKYLNGYGDYKAQVIEAIREAQWVYE